MADLVLGADIGGTSTRIGVADTTGQILSFASGGPGNPNVVGLDGSAAEIRAVMDRALAPVVGDVVSVVIGLAGGSRAAGAPGFLRAAVTERVTTPAELVSDLTVAFCSATPAADGYVIVAGTGAVAGRVIGTQLVQQRDGWGYLLGDEGSGFWMGRAAVRVTLDGLQSGTSLGPLQNAVLAATGTNDYLELLQACYANTATWLAQLSALVSRHANDDPLAADIADRAADLLEQLFDSLDPATEVPIVLAGSVLTKPGPVSDSFRLRISRHHDNPVLTADTGVIGALWLALGPRVTDGDAVHRRLTSSARRWV